MGIWNREKVRAPKMQKLKRLAGLGLTGVGIITAGMLISVFLYQGRAGENFSMLNHFVSELGESPWSEADYAFNYGLSIGCVSFLIFIFLLRPYLKGVLGNGVFLLGLSTSISGMLIGFFPMNFLNPHYIIAMVFFYSGLGMTVLFSIYVLRGKSKFFSKWLSVPGLISFILFFSFLFLTDPFAAESGNLADSLTKLVENRPDIILSAILEWGVVISTMLWIMLISFYFLCRAKNYGE
jgi:hypothetical membrane protein